MTSYIDKMIPHPGKTLTSLTTPRQRRGQEFRIFKSCVLISKQILDDKLDLFLGLNARLC